MTSNLYKCHRYVKFACHLGSDPVIENNVRHLRTQRNWTQQDLAWRLEVSRQSVNAIETGRYDPSLPLAFRIAELFGLAIEDVFESPSRRSSKAI